MVPGLSRPAARPAVAAPTCRSICRTRSSRRRPRSCTRPARQSPVRAGAARSDGEVTDRAATPPSSPTAAMPYCGPMAVAAATAATAAAALNLASAAAAVLTPRKGSVLPSPVAPVSVGTAQQDPRPLHTCGDGALRHRRSAARRRGVGDRSAAAASGLSGPLEGQKNRGTESVRSANITVSWRRSGVVLWGVCSCDLRSMGSVASPSANVTIAARIFRRGQRAGRAPLRSSSVRCGSVPALISPAAKAAPYFSKPNPASHV